MWSSGVLDLDHHFFLCWYSWALITVFQEMRHSQKSSKRVVWTPQNQGNITRLNHSILNPTGIPINCPLWCKLLIGSIYWLHLSWKILNEYSTESTPPRKQAETRNARFCLHCYMHQNELKILRNKTCMHQNSGTAKCQQHFKGNIIWSSEFNMIKNDNHCIISQPSHIQQT